MRQIVLTIIGIAIIVLALLGARFIINNSSKPIPKIEKIVKTVFTETAVNKTVPIIIPANGTLIAKNRLELYSEVQGVLQGSSHDFKVGQPYRKGESLIRLNSSEFFANVQSTKSEFYNLITSIMPDLRVDYPDEFNSWEAYLNNFDINKSVKPLPETTDEKAKYFVTGRGLITSYYNVKNLEQRLSKYNIRAPFNGVLIEALVTKGTLVRAGQKLGEFINTSVYELELAIGQSYSDLLKLGETVSLKTLEGDKTYTGKVTRINSRLDQTTQSIKVFVEVKGRGLREGMYLEAQLNAKEEPNAIKISRKLLVNQSEIFIVRDSILDLIPVTPVYFSPKEVVLKGVPDGTKMLSKSVPGSYAGMLVKIYSEKKDDTKLLAE